MGWVAGAVKFVAAIWGAVKAYVAAAYVIYLWTQKKKTNQSPTYAFDIQTQCSNELPVPVVYGRVKAGGNIVWSRTSYDNSTIYALVSFSEGPIKGFSDVRANDILISDLPGCSYTEYLGTQDQSIDSRCPGGVGFFKDSKYTGKVVTLEPGNYTAADLAAVGLVNEYYDYYDDDHVGPPSYSGSWLSSIRSNHHKITLYSGTNFNGDSIVLTEDVANLKQLVPNLNDGVYSVKIDPVNKVKVVGGMRNVAYIAFTIKASDKISGGIPNFTAIVEGRTVPTLSGSSSWVNQYSENPVWHLHDLLTHTRYGGGYTQDQINIESLKTAAAFCDELLSNGEPRFTQGLIIDWVDSLPDIVDQIRLCCRGYVVSCNGQLIFKIEQPETPSQHFGMEDIVKDSLEIYVPGKDEEWEKVTVTYCEPNQNWAKIAAQSIDEENIINPVQKDFVIVGINRFSQASRQAYFYRAYSKCCRFSGRFKTTIRALNRIPGDVITISDDIMGWVNKPVRVLEIRRSGDHGHEIYFREYNETIYNDALGSAKPTQNYSEMPNPFTAPPDPEDLVLTENTYVLSSGEVVPEIIVTFTPAYSMFYKQSLIQISENGTKWRDYGTTYDGSYLVHGIRIGQECYVRVKTVFERATSEGIAASIRMSGKNIAPSDVESLIATQNEYNRSEIILSWPAVSTEDNPDLRGYEARTGRNGWDTAVKVENNITPNTSCTYTAPANGNYVFYVKAIDNSGNYSVDAASTQITVMIVPDAVTQLAAIQDPKDRSALIVSWSASPGKDIAAYQLRYGDSWDTGTKIAETKETSYRWNLPVSGTYNIIVKAVTTAGKESATANVSVTVAIEPEDVTGFKATQSTTNRTRVTLSWDAPSKLDISHHVIKKGSSWNEGELVASHASGLFYDIIVTEEALQTFWIKAVSAAGIESQSAVSVSGVYNLNPTPVSAIQVTQNANDKSILNIMWSGVSDGDLSGYQVKIGQVWESAEALPTTQELYTTYKLSRSGNVKVMIKTINTAGFESDEVSISYYAIVEPANITGLVAYQNGEKVELDWEPPSEIDVASYEVREGATFEQGRLVASGLTQPTLDDPIDSERVYRYFVKAINRAGFYSRSAASVSVHVQNLPPKNIIAEYNEIEIQSGTHNDTEFGQSLINWSNMGGQFSDYPTTRFSEVGGSIVLKLLALNGVYASSGTYTCQQIDVGRVITANVTTQFISTVILKGFGSAILQIRVSTDGAIWTSWATFKPIQYTFRYIEFRVLLATSDTTKTPEVNQFVIKIDVPDTDIAKTVTVPVGGLTFDYGHDFYTLPVVTSTALGEDLHTQLISKTTNTATIKIKNNANEDVGGTSDVRIKGY